MVGTSGSRMPHTSSQRGAEDPVVDDVGDGDGGVAVCVVGGRVVVEEWQG